MKRISLQSASIMALACALLGTLWVAGSYVGSQPDAPIPSPAHFIIPKGVDLSASWEAVEKHPFPEAPPPTYSRWSYNSGRKQWERIKTVFVWNAHPRATFPMGLSNQFGQSPDTGQVLFFSATEPVSATITFGGGNELIKLPVHGAAKYDFGYGPVSPKGTTRLSIPSDMPPIKNCKYYFLPLQRNVYFIKQMTAGPDQPEADLAGEPQVTRTERVRVFDTRVKGRELICDDMSFAIYKRSNVTP